MYKFRNCDCKLKVIGGVRVRLTLTLAQQQVLYYEKHGNHMRCFLNDNNQIPSLAALSHVSYIFKRILKP